MAAAYGTPGVRRDDSARVALRLLQPCVQILDQVVGMFEASGKADEAVADPEFAARFWRKPLVRGGGGMRDQALGVAEVVGDA